MTHGTQSRSGLAPAKGADAYSDRIIYFEELFRSGGLDTLRTGSEVLTLAHQFQKIESQFFEKHREEMAEKRVAIMASFSTQHLTTVFKLYLARKGILGTIYEASYNSVQFEIMNRDSGMYNFAPEILILLLSPEALPDMPALFASSDELQSWVDRTAERFQTWWKLASAGGVRHIFHSLLPAPLFRPLGALEANVLFSPTNLIRWLNLQLVKTRPNNVTFFDLEAMAAQVGKENWTDERNAFISKQGFSMDYFGFVSSSVANLVAAAAGKHKKCLVIDLDNTLWGGVIGEDGIEGIKVGPGDPLGEAFSAFQTYIKQLKQRGVILAACSKNFDDVARLPFQKHPNMVLDLADFALFVANWEHKVDNLQTIASRLNIGLDSLVFVDDSIAEREQVRRFLPQVGVVDLPEDPAGYIRAIDFAGHFDWLELSREDLMRTDSYVTENQRHVMLSLACDYNDYLRSLEMQATFVPVDQSTVPRLTQLINKTNQFNLRGSRYSQNMISDFLGDGSSRHVIAVDFKDRFSHFGITSCVVLERQSDALFIDTWVMSCRVFKRGLEFAVVNNILNFARALGLGRIIGEYLPTKRNAIVSDLYTDLGFEKTAPPMALSSGALRFELPVVCAQRRDHFITVSTLE